MSEFVPKSDLEIAALDEEAVLDYINAARDAGDTASARLATNILAFRHESIVKTRVQAKAPAEHVDEIVAEVLMSAIRSSFDGRFVGEFKNWLKRITVCRIADFHRGREGDPKVVPLPDEHDGEEGVWISEGAEDTEIELLADRELAEQVCAERPDEIHRAAIRLYGFDVLGFQELGPAATKAEIKRVFGAEISDANLYQVWSRFLGDYKAAWLDANGAGGETT